ncbi:MAG: hypothetical protein JWM99_1013 [Verrucomicrobiales bacterium]|nr:hypothetical protein [Verrucomicrobiales bacterium]
MPGGKPSKNVALPVSCESLTGIFGRRPELAREHPINGENGGRPNRGDTEAGFVRSASQQRKLR